MAIDMGSLVEDKKDVRRERVSRLFSQSLLVCRLFLSYHFPFSLLAKMAGGETYSWYRDPKELQCSCEGRWSIRFVREIYSTRNGYEGTNQGAGLWVRRCGDRTGVGRTNVHSRHVRILSHCHLNICTKKNCLLYSGPDENQVARAKALTEDLLEVVHSEHAKARTVLQQQQMELHQAQAAYAAYSAGYSVRFLSFSLSIKRIVDSWVCTGIHASTRRCSTTTTW